MKRSTALWIICLCWLVFVGIPIAETRTLRLKISGEIIADTEGSPLKIKADSTFFQRAEDGKSSLVMDIGDTTNITTVVTNEVVTTIVTNGGGMIVTNMMTNIVTNIVTNVTANAFAIHLVDSDGSVLVTLFNFSEVTSVDTKPSFQRFFALGEGCGSLGESCPISSVIGEVSFSDAVIAGSIQFNTDAEARKVKATIHARGESDEGDFVFDGKVNANNPFLTEE